MKYNSSIILTLFLVGLFIAMLTWWLYRNCSRAAALEVQHFQLRKVVEMEAGEAGKSGEQGGKNGDGK